MNKGLLWSFYIKSGRSPVKKYVLSNDFIYYAFYIKIYLTRQLNSPITSWIIKGYTMFITYISKDTRHPFSIFPMLMKNLEYVSYYSNLSYLFNKRIVLTTIGFISFLIK
jgi:hypothetical protein